MTCYYTQHSKNHEKARQKDFITPSFQKVDGCYSWPSLYLYLELCQKSDEELYDVIKSAAAESAISEATQKMMSFSLSLRVYSPKIEASRSTSLPYPDRCLKFAFLSYADSSSCDPQKISKFDFSGLSESELGWVR